MVTTFLIPVILLRIAKMTGMLKEWDHFETLIRILKIRTFAHTG